MTRRTGYVRQLTRPIRAVVQHSAFYLLVMLSLMLIGLSTADDTLTGRVRTVVADAAAPFLTALSWPARAISTGATEIRDLALIRAENRRLRDDNIRLRQWETVARRLQVENRSLRTLTRAVPDAPATYVSARVIGDPGGAFVHSVLVNSGQRNGIAKGQPVITDKGLVGRVTHAGQRAARILLLTDLNSRVPVHIESSHERAILAGDNSREPALLYLGPNAEVEVGDRVVTSGEAGAFPLTLPVGVVSEISGDRVRVRPYQNLDRLDFVQIVDYGLGSIENTLMSADSERREGRE